MNTQSRKRLTSLNEVHDFVVQHEHDGSACATQDVGKRPLEETAGTFVLEDLLETVFHALVDLLSFRLRCLDLQATLHGVERVRDNARDTHSNLRDDELGEQSDGRRFLLVRVESLDNILDSELGTTVHDNTTRRWANAIVQREKTILFDGFFACSPACCCTF
jgi:hypothetical protein